MVRDKREKMTVADEAGAPVKPAVKTPTATPSGDFWRKPLEELSKAEWEALCDGCGRCCLVKLEDEDNGRIYHTDIACKLFDPATCQCKDYPNRRKTVPDCVSLSKTNVRKIAWLPPTCAYRLRAEGRDLEWWHYLVSGSRQTVHTAGISCKGRVGAFEDDLPFEDYPQRIVRWPGNFPKGKGRKPE
jgi:uncharacterized cysteine cluster protein YcgN (CxxCxxCC family)